MNSSLRHLRLSPGSTIIGDSISLLGVIPWEGTWILTKAYYTDQGGIVENDDNYATLTVEQGADKDNLTTLVTSNTRTIAEDNGLGTIESQTPTELAVTAGDAQEVDQGEVVKVSISKTGAGVVTNGAFMLVYEQGR